MGVLCPLYAWYLAKSVDDVLNAALDGAGTNMSISVECDRARIAEGFDALTVTVKLVKGDRGSVDLHDAKGRVFFASRADPLQLDFDDGVRNVFG